MKQVCIDELQIKLHFNTRVIFVQRQIMLHRDGTLCNEVYNDEVYHKTYKFFAFS